MSHARDEGVTCAITNGMACVHYGIAQTTKDCYLLCDPEQADIFLHLIENTRLKGVAPIYRGNLSPPMDKRWLVGGWTSYFYWSTPGKDGAYLDVFGIPPRASSPWQNEIEGFYSGRHTVAEMKRTDRDKDWPFATALGEQMLENGEERGWLHIFDSSRLLAIAVKKRAKAVICPSKNSMKFESGLRVISFRMIRTKALLPLKRQARPVKKPLNSSQKPQSNGCLLSKCIMPSRP
ncbi:MAG: hypothetical protein L3J39_00125 [Verrucomicrobiales bacterium]|nr:hypothetical protein [Verrucomicrobiales bacterium]